MNQEMSFPIELYRSIATDCKGLKTIGALSLASKSVHYAVAPALYHQIHYTPASAARRREDYLARESFKSFIKKAKPWCRILVIDSCHIDDELLDAVVLPLSKVAKLRLLYSFVNALILMETPMPLKLYFPNVTEASVTEHFWGLSCARWVAESCPNVSSMTVIYTGARVLHNGDGEWTAASATPDPGAPLVAVGLGLRRLRFKVPTDQYRVVADRLVTLGIAFDSVEQLELDIYPAERAFTGDLMLRPRILKDCANLSHLTITSPYGYMLQQVENIRDKLETLTIITKGAKGQEALVNTLRILPRLSKLRQYLIKVLVDGETEMVIEHWSKVDIQIWLNRNRHPIPCGKGIIFRHVRGTVDLQREVQNRWARFFHTRAFIMSSQLAGLVGYPGAEQ
ncbi:hypothetical protein C8J56DRAFT_904379 [Mycena floridula]|nr:hypothetical protein C8J56DRAFT_904379 [Mycena floridula]